MRCPETISDMDVAPLAPWSLARLRCARLLPLLLAITMLGNVIDCVRIDPRGSPVVQQVRRQRRRRLP